MTPTVTAKVNRATTDQDDTPGPGQYKQRDAFKYRGGGTYIHTYT
jgi:hypothetical protein